MGEPCHLREGDSEMEVDIHKSDRLLLTAVGDVFLPGTVRFVVCLGICLLRGFWIRQHIVPFYHDVILSLRNPRRTLCQPE